MILATTGAVRQRRGVLTPAAAVGVTVTSVTPASGIPGDSVVIAGTGFTAGQAVTICGQSVTSPTFDSSIQITATVPTAARGLGNVAVAGVSLANSFTAPRFFDAFTSGSKSDAQESWQWIAGNGPVQPAVVAANGYGGRTYSLSYPFTATDWVEQRFGYGTAQYEIWIELPILIPANYYHNGTDPGGNNKFILFNYDETCRCNFELTPQGDGSSNLRPQFTHGGAAGVQSVRDLDGGKSGTAQNVPNFIVATTGMLVPGTYAIVRVQIRTTSAYDANDGTMELWVNGVSKFAMNTLDLWNENTTSGARPQLVSLYLWGADNVNPSEATTYNQGYFAVFDSDPGW